MEKNLIFKLRNVLQKYAANWEVIRESLLYFYSICF